jgi:hypothetical protein
MEAALQRGDSELTVMLGGTRYTISLDTCVQQNPATKYRRNIRRVLVGGGNNVVGEDAGEGGGGGVGVAAGVVAVVGGGGGVASAGAVVSSTKPTPIAADIPTAAAPPTQLVGYTLKSGEHTCADLVAPLKASHNDRICISDPVEAINKTLDKLGPNTKFVDADFPPSERSVNWNSKAKSVQYDSFNRLEEIAPKVPQLFVDGVDPDDVIQGRLGNCWFVQCLAGVATRRRAINAMITPAKYNPHGVYGIRFFDEEQWHTVIIDDYIPCRTQGGGTEPVPSCAKCRDPNECWVMLVEKAYAKLHTCYQSMTGGCEQSFGPQNVLHGMLGGESAFHKCGTDAEVAASVVAADTSKHSIEGANEIWKLIQKYTTRSEAKSWVIGCGTKDQDDEAVKTALKKDKGLISNHAYSILASVEVDGTRLIFLRNPHGRTSWTGAWSPTDKVRWTHARVQ